MVVERTVDRKGKVNSENRWYRKDEWEHSERSKNHGLRKTGRITGLVD